tara:strand:- start:7907 stop:8422 length:516 start_codon:yes stop_codon:yes gene_type:complete
MQNGEILEPCNFVDPITPMRFVGWEQTQEALGEAYKYLFADSTIKAVSQKITQLLEGADEKGRKIIYADERIREMISQIFNNSKRPNIGAIKSKDIIPQEQVRDDIRWIINQTIEIITKTIRTELDMIKNNKKLSIWDSVYGDFNRKGLRAHPIIKIRKKHPQYMAFNMNY